MHLHWKKWCGLNLHSGTKGHDPALFQEQVFVRTESKTHRDEEGVGMKAGQGEHRKQIWLT